MTKYFLDTEFIEDGKTIDLVSIGIICDDGRSFYFENSEADLTKANDWVKENVLVHLVGGEVSIPRSIIRERLINFVNSGETKPEFWAYYADYDWVVLCQLFGTMIDLPNGWPMFCMDIKQEAVRLGDPTLPAQTGNEHHALADAFWNQEAYNYLVDYARVESRE
jgi:hypothetical protein